MSLKGCPKAIQFLSDGNSIVSRHFKSFTYKALALIDLPSKMYKFITT